MKTNAPRASATTLLAACLVLAIAPAQAAAPNQAPHEPARVAPSKQASPAIVTRDAFAPPPQIAPMLLPTPRLSRMPIEPTASKVSPTLPITPVDSKALAAWLSEAMPVSIFVGSRQ